MVASVRDFKKFHFVSIVGFNFSNSCLFFPRLFIILYIQYSLYSLYFYNSYLVIISNFDYNFYSIFQINYNKSTTGILFNSFPRIKKANRENLFLFSKPILHILKYLNIFLGLVSIYFPSFSLKTISSLADCTTGMRFFIKELFGTIRIPIYCISISILVSWRSYSLHLCISHLSYWLIVKDQ